MSDRRTVKFPSRLPPDFEIHYRDTDFHVHQHVLEQTSGYFRAYFMTFPTQFLDSQPNTNRRQDCERLGGQAEADAPSVATVSADPGLDSPVQAERDGSTCSHSPLRRCITLPDNMSLAGTSTDCRVDDFEVFLRHLYFASHYRFPPYQAKRDVYLAAPWPRPVSFLFSPPLSYEDIDNYALDARGGRRCYHPQLLSLFHYFDCERAWKQCMAVILVVAEETGNELFWLKELAPFGRAVKVEEEALVQIAATHADFADTDTYRELMHGIQPRIMLRLIVAVKAARNW